MCVCVCLGVWSFDCLSVCLLFIQVIHWIRCLCVCVVFYYSFVFNQIIGVFVCIVVCAGLNVYVLVGIHMHV